MDLAIVEELKNAGLIKGGKKKLGEAYYSSQVGFEDGDGKASPDDSSGFQFASPMGGANGMADDGKRNQLRPGDVKDLFEVCHNAMKSSRASLGLCMKIQGNKIIEQNRAAFAEMIKRIESDMDYMSKVMNDPDLMRANDEAEQQAPAGQDAAQNGQQQATNGAQGGNPQSGTPGGGGATGEE